MATRVVGGGILVPDGRTAMVTAPVTGTLAAAGNARPGSRVARGDAIFRLVPFAASERDQRIEAERAVATAEAEEQAARQRLERVQQFLKDGAASQRAVEEARAQHGVAAAALVASRDRLKVVSRNPISPQGDIIVTAPLSGVLQTVLAAPGQTVSASAQLFEIAQVDTLWVRVPVYAGEADAVDAAEPAAVSTLGGDTPPLQARRVTAPLKADPAAASVDLYYELAAPTVTLRPGERVTVQLPLKSAQRGVVIPDSALVV